MSSEPAVRYILFIDDELKWLNFAQTVLSEAGYAVQSVGSVGEAWKILQNRKFDLALVDLKKVGQEAAIFQEAAKLQTERGHRIVVMFPTAPPPDKYGKIFGLGAHDCVDKPYDRSSLLALAAGQLTQKPAILIVEDDKDWRKRLVHYLEPESYQLEVADSFSSALDLIKGNLYDVIVLDLRLIEGGEDFEGMKLLHLLKEQGSSVSVIVISAYGTVEQVKEGFQIYDMCKYISKQRFDRDEYRQAVREAIRSKTGR
jgi:DNA-binding NtrC family response regulator